MTATGYILIADNEPAFLQATAEFLSQEGFHCECAPSASQTTAMLQKSRYDVLICDVAMPGNERLRVVRVAQEFVPGMPVILVAGQPSVDSAINSLRLPVVAYLTKPLDYRRFLEQIREATLLSHRYLVLSDICRHLRECCEGLEEARGRNLRLARMSGSHSTVSPLILRSLASCLSELMRLQGVPSPTTKNSLLCELLDCPQQQTCRHAIEDTIAVLQKTKNTFKSKDLAGLRCRLEHLVKKPSHLPHLTKSCATLS